ncbi:helix-turn-helix domain-containing protein [Paenibacillus tepidiphilus]|uniref:helix-turn-helix domain-containing protein n=1 Tax=Paenibacillus tepidiphilus TaxID=2608683 RepID=UPI0013A5A019|nr:helix-turn-helix transcriptional regulator [Paenibacillus tepidiphilus]
MNPGATILTEIEDYIERENLTISKFAERSGMHSGTLSNIVNGNRPIAMQQLDKITQAMGMNDGYFYDLYIECYIINGAADWRRIGPLLLRCAELNKLEAIHRVVSNILDNLFYLPMLFDTAEELFTQQKYAAAEIIYKSVAEGERFQHSERLALCHYRLFHIALGDNQEANLHAANQFEPYVERLDEEDQLDAIKQLIDMFTSLQRWKKVDELAHLLGHKSRVQYQHFKKKESSLRHSKHPLIFYILYSYLMISIAWSERGDYERALYYCSLISEFSSVEFPTDPAEDTVLIQFHEWNTANSYLYRFMSGDVEILPDYVMYVENHESEIFPALIKITQSANKFSLNIDDILKKFKRYIPYNEQTSRLGKVRKQLTSTLHTFFMSELSVYYFTHKNLDKAFYYLLESLESSIRITNNSNIVKCVALFEKNRALATTDQIQKYSYHMGSLLML